MVWAISIAVFLGIAVVALLLFLIYSEREQIRKALREKRASRHGARILSCKHRQPHDHVLVRLPQKAKPSRARVAYCTALAGDAFAVGLHFASAVDDWLIPDSDMSDDEGSSQLYRK
jgi:hypothetical protein